MDIDALATIPVVRPENTDTIVLDKRIIATPECRIAVPNREEVWRAWRQPAALTAPTYSPISTMWRHFVEMQSASEGPGPLFRWTSLRGGRCTDAGPKLKMVAYTRHELLGVIAATVPWNSPLLLVTWKLAPLLTADKNVAPKP